MTAIGVGSFVEYVGMSPNYQRGAVRIVSRLVTCEIPCQECGSLDGLFVSTDPLEMFNPWCPKAWKPFHGPEQKALGLTCDEPVARDWVRVD